MTDEYTCEDCGKPHLSISAMMNCPCWKYDRNGRAREDRGSGWLA